MLTRDVNNWLPDGYAISVGDLIKLVNDETFLYAPFGRIAVVVALFAAAWLLTRLAGRFAAFLIDRGPAVDAVGAETAVLDSLKQRETAISLVQTTIRYLFFGIALILALLVLANAKKVGAVVGASFIAIIAAFAAQRFLMDVIAGLLMFFERWFRVGDAVSVTPHGGEGVVEEVSLRYTTLRAANGEVVRINNSQIAAVRVTPRGKRELDVELFVSDEAGGRGLLERIASIVPVGPTHFIRRPTIAEAEPLDGELVRIRARATVAPGREWLAYDLLSDLLKERAAEGLLVHGPVVTAVDEHAARRYARAAYAGSAPPREEHATRVRRLKRVRRAGAGTTAGHR